MLHVPHALDGIVSSPHHAASRAGRDVPHDDRFAVAAAIAVAATRRWSTPT